MQVDSPGGEDGRGHPGRRETLCYQVPAPIRGRPDPLVLQARQEGQPAHLVTVPRAPARCTQWNSVQDAFWRLWQRAEEAA